MEQFYIFLLLSVYERQTNGSGGTKSSAVEQNEQGPKVLHGTLGRTNSGAKWDQCTRQAARVAELAGGHNRRIENADER